MERRAPLIRVVGPVPVPRRVNANVDDVPVAEQYRHHDEHGSGRPGLPRGRPRRRGPLARERALAGRLLDSWLDEAVARVPHRTAVVDGTTRLSYAELADRVGAVTAGLRGLGVTRGCLLYTSDAADE